jgi:cell division protein FtsQ
MSFMPRRFQPVIQTPPDVRLMNVTSTLLFMAVLLAVCASGLWWLLRNPAFTFQRIVVHGQTEHTDAGSLRARALPRLSGNFFTLDMDETRAVFESLPWIERAVVWRRWPGLLDVTLREHQPYALWGVSGVQMIDVNGQLFEATPGRAHAVRQSMPTLVGPEGQFATVLAMYRALAPLVTPLHARLAMLELQGRGSWRARLTGLEDDGAAASSGNNPAGKGAVSGKNAGPRAVIELGSGTSAEMVARLKTFVATAPEVAARHQRGVADVEMADLRHAGGYALRLKGVGTEGNATPAGARRGARG